MKVYLSKSQFEDDDKYQRIQAVIDYVNQLVDGLYTFEEINKEVVEVYFVDYYLAQVDNGGHFQFFKNSGYDAGMYKTILAGLAHMGAHKSKTIFQNTLEVLESLPDDSLSVFLDTTYVENLRQDHMPVFERLKEFDSKFYNLNSEFSNLKPQTEIIDLSYTYIATIQGLEVVTDDEWQNTMNFLLENVPNYEDRFAKCQQDQVENEPHYSKIARALCQQFQHELLSINAMDYGLDSLSDEEVFQNEKNGNYYCYVTTSKGYYYFIYNQENNTADFVKGETHKRLGTIQCDVILDK